MSKELVGSWIEPNIKKLVEKIAKTKGISLSEYIRTLILEDIDKRSLFTSAIKGETKS